MSVYIRAEMAGGAVRLLRVAGLGAEIGFSGDGELSCGAALEPLFAVHARGGVYFVTLLSSELHRLIEAPTEEPEPEEAVDPIPLPLAGVTLIATELSFFLLPTDPYHEALSHSAPVATSANQPTPRPSIYLPCSATRIIAARLTLQAGDKLQYYPLEVRRLYTVGTNPNDSISVANLPRTAAVEPSTFVTISVFPDAVSYRALQPGLEVSCEILPHDKDFWISDLEPETLRGQGFEIILQRQSPPRSPILR